MEKSEDILAQVGIGAMILFIGSLIAIVSSAYVMIAQLEVITQNTQAVVSTASKEAHTQVVFVGAWIEDGYDDYLFMIEYQSLGKEINVVDVGFTLWCLDSAGTLHRKTGDLRTWTSGPDRNVAIWEVGGAIEEPTSLESGKRYFIGVDGGTDAFPAGDQCGPNFIENEGIVAYYTIYLPFGGHTTQELRVTTFAVGESVI